MLTTDFNITRIAITNPAVADAAVVQPREILIDGKTAGTISLIVWGPTGRTQYDIVVEQPVTALQQNLAMLFPGEDIQVSTTEDSTLLSGQVSSTNIMLRAGEIAQASSAKRAVINLLQVPGGSESQQVLLQVRFAEVNRRVLQEVGLSMFLAKQNWAARTTTQQFSRSRLRRQCGRPEFRGLPESFLLRSAARVWRPPARPRVAWRVSKPRGTEPDRV